MKFALAVHGTRGDVEPCAAVGVELLRRGHDVRMAVPPNLVGLAESAGLAAVAIGPDSQEQVNGDFFRNMWKIQHPIGIVEATTEYNTRGWAEMGTTLTSLADGADLVLTAGMYQEVAANVAEYYDIPVAVLDYFPARAYGRLIPLLPAPLIRSTTSMIWWAHWHMTKKAGDAQRRELGLPKAVRSSLHRNAEREALEIQAYDELCLPGLAAELGSRRPFVGALTMESATSVDDEVLSWIAGGTRPIYFGFGSMCVESPADTIDRISVACKQLGERALICSGASQFINIPQSDHVKVVSAVNHSAVFPACRAVVHHGGAGTTAAGMRAGVPTLILWIGAEQPIWGAQVVKRLKIGSARRFLATTHKSLVTDLRRILAPQYAGRAREIASQMSKPADSVTLAADLLEDRARRSN